MNTSCIFGYVYFNTNLYQMFFALFAGLFYFCPSIFSISEVEILPVFCISIDRVSTGTGKPGQPEKGLFSENTVENLENNILFDALNLENLEKKGKSVTNLS